MEQNMNNEHAESQTRGTWSTEKRFAQSTDLAPSEAGTRGTSGGVENIGIGHAGAGRAAESSISSSLGGKIIAQLIQEAEDQLGVARKCIEWYVEEEQKALNKLQQLKQLQAEAPQE
jgi:hypothetical protein